DERSQRILNDMKNHEAQIVAILTKEQLARLQQIMLNCTERRRFANRRSLPRSSSTVSSLTRSAKWTAAAGRGVRRRQASDRHEACAATSHQRIAMAPDADHSQTAAGPAD